MHSIGQVVVCCYLLNINFIIILYGQVFPPNHLITIGKKFRFMFLFEGCVVLCFFFFE